MTSKEGHLEVVDFGDCPNPNYDKKELATINCDILGSSNETVILVAGDKVPSLIDSGSMISTVGEDYYRANLEDTFPLREDFTPYFDIEGAGGHKLDYVGVADIEVSLSERGDILSVPMLVQPSTPYNRRIPFIIGTNVLKRVNQSTSLPDPVQHAISLLQDDGSSMSEVNLFTCGQVTLPPRKITVVTARIGAHHSFNLGVPSVADSLPGGVCIPQSLLDLGNSRKVSMCLANFTDHSIEIPKLQKIATVQSARAIDVQPSDSQATDSGEDSKISIDHDSTNIKDVPVNLDDTDLTPVQKTEVKQLLQKYADVFASSKTELGTAVGVKHGIRLNDDQPFKDRPRRIPPAYYQEVKQHIEEMLACGAIRRSNSPWCSNVVLVRKQDGTLRLCLDFRRLNARTIQDAYHLPRIEDTLDKLAGSQWFSCLDLQSGYWQVEMEEQDKQKTAFYVGNLGSLGNLFECNRMPFGLTNAPATFQRLMEMQLGDLPFVQLYLDDIIVFSGTFSDHLERLEKTLQRLRASGLKLKPSKCHLFRKKVKYLGHIISEEGIETDPEKIDVIQKWPEPETVQDLRRVLGFFGYYRRFVKGYSVLAKPLHDLLKGHENTSRSNKKAVITLTDEARKAFLSLKQMLSQPPILGYADYSLPFELHTDASLDGLGAVLYQHQEGRLRVIAYASRGLKPSETRYPAHKLEFLALKWAICEKFYDYLYGHHFEVLTDNNPLAYVLTTAKLDSTGHRWIAELGAFNFNIKYRSGRLNADADALSRLGTITEESVHAICNGIIATEEDPISDQLCLTDLLTTSISKDVGYLTLSDWTRMQLDDPMISILYQAVKNREKPEKHCVDSYPDLKILLRDWEKLYIKDGVLYRRSHSSTGEELSQLVLPSSQKEQLLTGLHNDLGHMGRDRTLEMVRSRYFWPRLADDVTKWVRECEACIKRKILPDRAALVNIQTTQPMELVCMDYLSLEPSKGKVENILVITDHFTRLAYAVPTRNQTAKTTAKALHDFFLIYGYPKFLHSDQGRNFLSKTISELCDIAGITKTRTTPYHAMGNGMTEKFNHTLLNMLGTLEEDQKKDWKSYVPSMVQAYNSTRHDSTGYSPFYLMMGRHPRLPIDVLMGISREEDLETDYVRGVQNRLKHAFETATKLASKSSSRHKHYYDRKIRGAVVEVGDRVLVRNTSLRGKQKLANKWEDVPYSVVDQPDPDIPVFKVVKEGKGKVTRTLHRNMLLPINFIPLPAKDNSQESLRSSRRRISKRKQKAKETPDDDREIESSSDETSENSSDSDYPSFSLNPLAEEFYPHQPTTIPSLHSSADTVSEDPQMADREEHDSVELVADVIEVDGVFDLPVPADDVPSDSSASEEEEVVGADVAHISPPVPAVRKSLRTRAQPDRYVSEDWRAKQSSQIASDLRHHVAQVILCPTQREQALTRFMMSERYTD